MCVLLSPHTHTQTTVESAEMFVCERVCTTRMRWFVETLCPLIYILYVYTLAFRWYYAYESTRYLFEPPALPPHS